MKTKMKVAFIMKGAAMQSEQNCQVK